MTFGFSRDDAGKFLEDYYAKKIFENDPFARVDQEGVGRLIEMAVELGRKTKPGHQARHLRRTRRRPDLCGILLQSRPRLCVLLAVPRAHRAPGGSTGRYQKQISVFSPVIWGKTHL